MHGTKKHEFKLHVNKMRPMFSLQFHAQNTQFDKIYNRFLSGQTETLSEFKLLEGHVVW